MSRLRISTKDSNRAISLRDYLSQHGLHVVMLSATELEIETGDLSEELRNEISSWQHSHDLEIIVDTLPQNISGATDTESDAELADFEVPQREFILAPHWRRVKAKTAVLGVALAATRERTGSAFGQASKWLHETEEKILARSTKGEEERRIAEERAWAETIQPLESMERVEVQNCPENIEPRKVQTPPRIQLVQLRERMQSGLASLAAFNSRMRIRDGGKAVAFAGGVVMAGLIGIGLSVSHIDKTSAATMNSGAVSNPVPAAVANTSAQPQHQTKTLAPAVSEPAHLPKPSPVTSTRATSQPRSAEVMVHRYQAEVAEDDGPEVVTHYYRQKTVPDVKKTTAKDVKHYSDMD